MPHTSIYPKILIGSAQLSSDTISQVIKAHLSKDKIEPSFSSIDFFDPEIAKNEHELQKVEEADFCILIFGPKDLNILNERLSDHGLSKRDLLMFLIGYIQATLNKDRILFAKPAKIEVPFLTALKGIDITKFDPNPIDLQKSFRIICNKLYRAINSLGLRNKQAFTKDPEEILDHYIHYKIKILNPEGDAILSRKIDMEAKENRLSYREHRIFSDSTTSSYEALRLKAWDEKNQELSIEKIYDTPAKKDFKVFFRNQMFPGDRLAYTYEFHWNGMFPLEGSSFLLRRTAKKMLFDLILPNSWDLLHANVIEKRVDGIPSYNTASIKRLNEITEENFTRYCFQLTEFDSGIMEAEIKWAWKIKE